MDASLASTMQTHAQEGGSLVHAHSVHVGADGERQRRATVELVPNELVKDSLICTIGFCGGVCL
jgi:hypothetical protein